MQNLIQLLHSLNLSDREAKIYLFCLEHGVATIGELAKFLKTERMIVYRAVDKMSERGILDKDKKTFGFKVLAAPPQHLIEIAKKEQRKWKKIELQLKDNLPRLRGLQKTPVSLKPKTHFFEGLDEIKKACGLFLEGQTGGEAVFFANNEKVEKIWPTFHEDIREMRIQNGVQALMFHPDGNTGRKLQLADQKHLRRTKLLPAGIHYNSTLGVLEDRLLLMGFTPPQAVVLENKELAMTISIVFKLLWEKL